MYYTGIGARKTPPNVRKLMTNVSRFLDKYGYVLRSGGANGADKSFEEGSTNKEIYLPWKGFNGNDSELFFISGEAFNIARKFHPNWYSLSSTVKKFHARNCYQLLGYDLTIPSKFVILWTPNGKEVGGTGQAIRIARYYEIPIYNLALEDDRNDLKNFINNVTLLYDRIK